MDSFDKLFDSVQQNISNCQNMDTGGSQQDSIQFDINNSLIDVESLAACTETDSCNIIEPSEEFNYILDQYECSSDGDDFFSGDVDLNSLSAVTQFHDYREMLDESMSRKSESEEKKLIEDLREWYLLYNVTHQSLKGLLKILKKDYAFLPLDPRTLLGTRSFPVEKFQSGEYVYFGLKENLVKHISSKMMSDELVLDMGIDGFKNT